MTVQPDTFTIDTAPGAVDSDVGNSSNASAVTWSAIIAGAVTAVSVSLILLLLGSGLGFAAASPWARVPAGTFTATAAIWLIVTQWSASSLGGYLAGRLRTKWVAVHTDEVFFRDTAHGFLAWALGTLVTVAFLATTLSAMSGVPVDTHTANVATDVAQKAAAKVAMFGALSLFIGAFIASAAAALGGKQRDEY
jgi:hypothetical protein